MIRAPRSRRRGGRDSEGEPVRRAAAAGGERRRPRLPPRTPATCPRLRSPSRTPVGFGSAGGPGSRPRPPPSRRLPGLSPGRGVRRGSRPRVRGRPSQTSSQRSAPEYGRWVFAGRALDDVLATAGVRSKPVRWQTRRPPPARSVVNRCGGGWSGLRTRRPPPLLRPIRRWPDDTSCRPGPGARRRRRRGWDRCRRPRPPDPG